MLAVDITVIANGQRIDRSILRRFFDSNPPFNQPRRPADAVAAGRLIRGPAWTKA
jgi:hypothetical protein